MALEDAIEWAEYEIQETHAQIGDENHNRIIESVTNFSLVTHERQEYFKHVFRQCFANGQQEEEEMTVVEAAGSVS